MRRHWADIGIHRKVHPLGKVAEMSSYWGEPTHLRYQEGYNGKYG